jgi:N-acetylmuramoyl-L-alanine amidase
VKFYLIKAAAIVIIVGLLLALCMPDVTRRGGDHAYVKTSAEKGRPTVIIDAGHGGADGGAVSPSGITESTVNLDVAGRLDSILAFFGTHTVMTRTSEQLDYSEKADTIREKKAEDQARRLKLINTTPNAVLLSIHQNIYPGRGPFGAQVLYAPAQGSKALAEAMQKLLIDALNKANRRTASKVPDSVLLMNHCTCPAVLIECGFLSNPDEENLLRTDAYRLKVAAVIAAGYLAYKNLLTDHVSGGSDEGKNSLLLY